MTVVHALSILALALTEPEGADPRPFPPEVVTSAVPGDRARPSVPLSEPRLIPVKPSKEAAGSRGDERKPCGDRRPDAATAPEDAPR
jgi:hypothetical protein